MLRRLTRASTVFNTSESTTSTAPASALVHHRPALRWPLSHAGERRGPLAAVQRQGAAAHLPEVGDRLSIARQPCLWREGHGERRPPTFEFVPEDSDVRRFEDLIEPGERRRGRSVKLVVAPPHQGEGVLVCTKPQMEPVLFDPVAERSVAAARTLAPETPSLLVDRYLVSITELGARQLERRRQPGDATAEDGDALLVRHQLPLELVAERAVPSSLHGSASPGAPMAPASAIAVSISAVARGSSPGRARRNSMRANSTRVPSRRGPGSRVRGEPTRPGQGNPRPRRSRRASWPAGRSTD